MGILGNVISSIFSTNLANRLINHYTAHGIIIVVMQLANMGVLPAGVTEAIDGLDTKDIALWTTLAIGIYFVFHLPKFKSKLDKLNYEVALTKVEAELLKAKEELSKYKEVQNGSK